METLYDPVTLRTPYKSRRVLQSEELKLPLKIMRVILAAMIGSQEDACPVAYVLVKRTKYLQNRHSHRFKGIKPAATFIDMPAQDLVIKMIYHTEKPAPPILPGKEPFPVGSPHPVGQVSLDVTFMLINLSFRFGTGDREKVIRPHDPVDSCFADFDPPAFKPLPSLLVAFINEMTSGDFLPDFIKQGLIGDHDPWPTTGFLLAVLRFPIPSGRSDPGHLQNQPKGINQLYRFTNLIFHLLNEFPRTEPGEFSFFLRSSISICNRPTVRSYSAYRLSSGRFFNPDSPPLRKAVRHSVKSAMVTWYSRLTSSMVLPRNNSRTIRVFIFALFRFCFTIPVNLSLNCANF